MVTLFENLDRKDAETFSLVLSAVGIGHRVSGRARHHSIDVPELLAEDALAAIQRYRTENTLPPPPSRARRWTRPFSFSGIFIALGLLTVHLAVLQSQAPLDYRRTFGADAHLILNGQLYRCVTALLLHVDATHVVANMAGMTLFGGAVCSLAGIGVGWLTILACGISGNLLNAWAYQTHHLSVGASTAIFGAIGILCAVRAVDAMQTGRGWKQVALIAGAGVSLLAFLGTGARSDVSAHLFGWLSGLFFGSVEAMVSRQPLSRKWQVACGAIAVAILLAAWIRGAIG